MYTKNNTTMLTTTRLQQLIEAIHQGKDQALDELCRHFQPLIKKEAHRQAIYNSLGEDAEGAAWEYLITCLRDYRGQDYQHLPGYLQLKLHYHLLHLMQKQGQHWDHEAQLEDITLLSDSKSPLEQSLRSLTIRQSLAQLPQEQRHLVKLISQRQSQATMAQQLHCSQRTLQRRLQALRASLRQTWSA